MLDFALQYAARGWRVFPLHVAQDGVCSCGRACESPGKHPRIKKWQDNATTDRAQVEAWWGKWPQAGIAIATGIGSGLVVVDLDNLDAINLWRTIGAPPTLCAITGRGAHLYYEHPGLSSGETWPNSTGSGNRKGVDTRGDGGYVIAPPSLHPSGRVYRWRDALALVARLPPEAIARLNEGRGGARPARGRKEKPSGATAALASALRDLPSDDDLLAAAGAIPNEDVGWEDWNRIGMAFWAASGGSDAGACAFDAWSSKSEKKHDSEAVAARWQHYFTSPPADLSFGTLYHAAKQADPLWEPPSRRPRAVEHPAAIEPQEQQNAQKEQLFPPAGEKSGFVNGVSHANGNGVGGGSIFGELPAGSADNPLIQLNNEFCTIGDVGGKCLVLSWVPSKIDPKVKVPSFQTFKAFSERYGHKYVAVPVKKVGKQGDVAIETQHKPLGAYWLQWYGRRFYERLEMVPGAPEVLPDGSLNLWRGFGVEPRPGSWALMKAHITDVLADGDAQAAVYIMKYAAWCVQNAGEPAEVALVFRGGKGVGKGAFAGAIRRIFGAHGMQIYSGKHLTGQFNGHLRACLLLFADEAFWAGDKQGESTLKGMITERTLVIEHKGVDAEAWKNRLKVIMAANADWVVPASKDERRYAVFNVSDSRAGDRDYFKALFAELNGGGLEAMLHDLLGVKLGDWHPRDVVKTEALQEQKAQSLSPLAEWWEYSLQNGWMPFANAAARRAKATELLGYARQFSRRLGDVSPKALGMMLMKVGASPVHTMSGNQWELPKLADCRQKWEATYGAWKWDETAAEWQGDMSESTPSFTSFSNPSRTSC